MLVGVWTEGSAEQAHASLTELARLAETAGSQVLDGLIQRRSRPDPATFIGSGKVDELRDAVRAAGADTVICDGELSPGQLRQLEDKLKVKVIDRTALILDIFAQHARSRDGKAQVELAQLSYLLPRLRGWGEALSRQVGGRAAGGVGIGGRGPGETKIELDRRRIRHRMSKLRREIAAMRQVRETQRGERRRHEVPGVAIVGYTNAGKSSLLNALTGAGVLVEDALFATLDPTTRRTVTPDGRGYTLTDTVGFVRHLPHQLVEAFRSTLEETAGADLLVHVVDALGPAARRTRSRPSGRCSSRSARSRAAGCRRSCWWSTRPTPRATCAGPAAPPAAGRRVRLRTPRRRHRAAARPDRRAAAAAGRRRRAAAAVHRGRAGRTGARRGRGARRGAHRRRHAAARPGRRRAGRGGAAVHCVDGTSRDGSGRRHRAERSTRRARTAEPPRRSRRARGRARPGDGGRAGTAVARNVVHRRRPAPGRAVRPGGRRRRPLGDGRRRTTGPAAPARPRHLRGRREPHGEGRPVRRRGPRRGPGRLAVGGRHRRQRPAPQHRRPDRRAGSAASRCCTGSPTPTARTTRRPCWSTRAGVPTVVTKSVGAAGIYQPEGPLRRRGPDPAGARRPTSRCPPPPRRAARSAGSGPGP